MKKNNGIIFCLIFMLVMGGTTALAASKNKETKLVEITAFSQLVNEVQTNLVNTCANHKYGAFKVVKQATCAKEGLKQRVCNTCGRINIEPIPVKAHKYGAFKVVKKATCTQEGVKQRVCKTCRGVNIEPIAKKAHNFNKAKKCKNCGMKVSMDVIDDLYLLK